MTLHGRDPAFTLDAAQTTADHLPARGQRGYESTGDLWSPGLLPRRADAGRARHAGRLGRVVGDDARAAARRGAAGRARAGGRGCSRGPAAAARACRARTPFHAELVLAADQFLITPAGRVEDAARAHAAGEEVRTVIAGYHWFTDWGRDTMISLEGLTLTTGRIAEAGYILRTFAHYIRDGLIPNMFPEGEKQGLYHTADATLWFFHAIDRYVAGHRRPRRRSQLLLPRLIDIVEHHIEGTRFGIGVDPPTACSRQGAEGYQLTWMDAKVGDWVVTPRRGKAVEINALWYNALRLLEGWVARGPRRRRRAEPYARARRAGPARRSTSGSGTSRAATSTTSSTASTATTPPAGPTSSSPSRCEHPVLDRSRWEPVLDVVREQLLTPVGLRSLAPGHPDYKPRYFGDLRARDAAYHQGTVWAWLIGPFIDAWLKVHPDDRAGARRFLEGFVPHLDEACLGIDQRDLRRRAAIHPARLHRPGLERRRGAACWVKTAR